MAVLLFKIRIEKQEFPDAILSLHLGIPAFLRMELIICTFCCIVVDNDEICAKGKKDMLSLIHI